MEKVINEALRWVGYLEKKSNSALSDFTANSGNKNYTIFAELYKQFWGNNYQAQPWCAVFVSVIFKLAYNNDNVMPHFAYCPSGVSNFKKKNAFFTTPLPGDVVFFTNGKRAYHTGIVISIDKERIYTIEGNTSSGSEIVANGGAVAKKSYLLNNNKILGYGRPDFKEVQQVINKKNFSDCKNHYAEKHIKKLSEYGIINGCSDGLFHPDEKITRADAAIMIANALSVCGK